MKKFMVLSASAVSLALLVSHGQTSKPAIHNVTPKHDMTKEDVDRDMKELSNWGRWGKEDQLGAANLLTAAKRKQASAEIHEGFTVSLSHDYIQERAADATSPFVQRMGPTGANNRGQFVVDSYSWPAYHGYAHTHIDALCHMSEGGLMYNGFSRDEVDSTGAHKLAIGNLKAGIVSRGVLIDIPRLKGVQYLEPETPIYPEDLDAWEKMAHVKIEKGDIVFVRTGRWARRAEKGPWQLDGHAAGLHASCARWLKTRDIAMLGSDGVSDVMPSLVPGVVEPIHQLMLIAMGVNLFDNTDLEALAAACAQRKRWSFLISANPLAVPAGTGSPVNPIAVF
jgi:kynurenine formamidase